MKSVTVEACRATIKVRVVLPHLGMLPSEPSIASPGCSRQRVIGTYEVKGETLMLKPEGSSRNDWKGRTLTRTIDVSPNKELEHKPTAPIRNVFSRRGAM